MSRPGRLGRGDLPPRRRQPGGVGPRGARPPRARGRRDRARRRLRLAAGSRALLLERLPEGRVIGVDAAPSMIEEARSNLDEFGDRVELRVAEPARAGARRAGRRRVLERDLPLDHRPRAALRARLRRAAAGRPARGPVRGRGQRRRVEARASRRSMGDERFAAYFRGMAQPGTSPRSATPRSPRARRASTVGKVLAREPHRRAARAARLRALRRPQPAPRAAARRAARRVHRRRARLDAAPAAPRVRAPQHLGEDGRRERAAIVVLPGDGIGPEIVAAARRCSTRSASSSSPSTSIGGASIDAHGTALTDEVLDACRDADAVLLGAVGGPKWDTTDPDGAAPRAGAAGPAQGPRPVRQPAPGQAEPGARSTPARCARTGSRAPTCWSCASSPAASTSATAAATATAPTTPASTRSPRSSGSPRSAFEAAERRSGPGHLGRQGERARDLAAVARDRDPRWPRAARVSSSTTCWSTTRRCSSSSNPAALRRDPDREHVRRHPQRRVGDAHRLAGHAAFGEPRRGGSRRVRAGARLGARHRRQGDRQPAGHVPLGGDAAARRARPRPTRPPRSRRPSTRALARGPAHPRPGLGRDPSRRRSGAARAGRGGDRGDDRAPCSPSWTPRAYFPGTESDTRGSRGEV